MNTGSADLWPNLKLKNAYDSPKNGIAKSCYFFGFRYFRPARIFVSCIIAIWVKKVIWIYKFRLPLYYVAEIQPMGRK